jgi:hypothetical protein
MQDRDKCAYPRAPDARRWAQNLVVQSDCSDLAEKKRKGTNQPAIEVPPRAWINGRTDHACLLGRRRLVALMACSSVQEPERSARGAAGWCAGVAHAAALISGSNFILVVSYTIQHKPTYKLH